MSNSQLSKNYPQSTQSMQSQLNGQVSFRNLMKSTKLNIKTKGRYKKNR